jgi:glucosyl-dolichyl phosphate glucuronosyltransferase
MPPAQAAPTVDVTVVVPAYTEERWDLTCRAIDSVLGQSILPREIIVCVDHNPQLYERFRARWSENSDATPTIRVVESRYDGHVSASRTTGMELAESAILLFLDDDASATPHWLERMLAPFSDPKVIAVGGNPRPLFSRPRPRWFPFEFDWIFGCSYRGLPNASAPVLRLIGTTIAARKDDLVAIGGFHFDVFEDMAMCHRLRSHSPGSILQYEPTAVVDHYVHQNRLSWHYFWHRAFSVNRGKVAVMKELGEAGDLEADRRFVTQTLRAGFDDCIKGLLRGDVGGALRFGATLVGLGSATVGYGVGLVQWNLRLPASWPSGRRP